MPTGSLADLEGLDWPENIKSMQANWIGRSEGAEVLFDTPAGGLRIFTTRPDTLWGATFMVLSPEHPFVLQLTSPDQRTEVQGVRRPRRGRRAISTARLRARRKTGVFTGARATNPVNGEQIPIWVADYVLMGYGTGAIMAVPATTSAILSLRADLVCPFAW